MSKLFTHPAPAQPQETFYAVVGWLVGFDFFHDEKAARAHVRNPNIEPIPVYKMMDGFRHAPAQPVEPTADVSEGWRSLFAERVYADLAAADNQDVPLEDYPARILAVLDAIIGPRHPAVAQWRNDAIQACAAIADRYGQSHAANDMRALLAATTLSEAQPVERQELSELRELLATLLHFIPQNEPQLYKDTEAMCASLIAKDRGQA